MIEINLLPEELKAKVSKINIDVRYYLLIIPLVAAILLLFHIAFGINSLMKQAQVNALTKQWKQLEPQLKNIEGNRGANGISPEEAQAIRKLMQQRVAWAEKLNKLSMYVPQGVWFTSMNITPSEIVVRGTVYSVLREEMSLINKFMINLKKDINFFDNFTSLELTSVQKNMKGSYETIDFVLTGVLKVSKDKAK